MARRGAWAVTAAIWAVLMQAGIAGAQPGTLDPTFGAGGKLVTPVGSGDAAAASVALQPDGRIVVAGYASNGTDDDFALARYLQDGTPDPSFGSGGITLTDFTKADRAEAVTLQPDGKIVAVGFAGTNLAVARYLSDGSLDPSFGVQGKVATGFGGLASAEAVAIQGDGKIVVAGWVIRRRQGDMAIARYNPDGTLDPSFHTNGEVILNLGSSEYAEAVAIQANGSILVAGASGDDGTQFALARFRTTGSLDKTFGSGTGAVVTSFALPASWANAVVVGADGAITAAGFAYGGTRYEFALARYLPSGQLDTSFGGNGKVLTSLDGPGDDTAQALALQPGGDLVVAGSQGDDFALARYAPTGALDSTFGVGGHVITDLGSVDQAQANAIQEDGKVLVAGFSGDDTRLSFALARYLGS